MLKCICCWEVLRGQKVNLIMETERKNWCPKPSGPKYLEVGPWEVVRIRCGHQGRTLYN